MTTAVLAPAAGMQRALARLRPEHRAVLAQICGRRRSLPEAAAALDLPVTTVKARLDHAMRALHVLVAEQGVSRSS